MKVIRRVFVGYSFNYSCAFDFSALSVDSSFLNALN
jgi:hypothetical protein